MKSLPSQLKLEIIMDPAVFKSWLDDYGRAWETRDPQVVARLFAEEATYQETPFVEPLRGRSAISEYWSNATRTQEQIRFGYEVLAFGEGSGVTHWWVSFFRLPSRTPVKLDGIFVVTFDQVGLCHKLQGWWHRQENNPK